ncbi:hypothetical protein P154DRAFT_557972 [Amniculicola lignicola CBS 123094]|uniref:ABC transporter domain-containing protein n=1 Tax=Amniculicola lignicola CBS 123094 TaxID=1392246 RepID=A0A6A5VYI0_9PLEO|nr:hypothetical protein P154DRAFT_557972 [Amniculicola lignicola CBS 123094]
MTLLFRNLSVHGYGSYLDYQKTFGNYPLVYLARLVDIVRGRKRERIDILRTVEGLLNEGETLMVLGRPGRGCTTLLKILAGQTFGLRVDPSSTLHYAGLQQKDISSKFRGRCVYQAEIDVHFPHLTLRQTLEVAREARVPNGKIKNPEEGSPEEQIAASVGLAKVLDTKIGNDLVPGLSGGERKRTSIAEILTSNTWMQCWDNNTRGLDSATALNFVRFISHLAKQRKTVAVVSLYQASQDIYNLGDKVLLLYEGRQIFFGKATSAKTYFETLGFVCPQRSNDADFLTAVTQPQERQIRKGYEGRAPQTPDDFAASWQQSSERVQLLPTSSPYMIPLSSQISLLSVRALRRIHQDLAALVGSIVGNTVVSIILGSMFYNLDSTTDSFLGRTVIIFFGVVLNCNIGAFEGTLLWEHRSIVEKHHRYGFYQPVAEAISSMLVDLPNKLLMTVAVNTPYYFLAHLRRTPEAFFTYLLFSFVAILMGSMLWRAAGAMSRTLSESQPPGAAVSTLLTLYTGFIIPVPQMKPWLRWFAYINPCFYMYESLLVTEFSGREFTCTKMIPQGQEYLDYKGKHSVCGVQGAIAGSNTILGDAYLLSSFEYHANHKWRNLGIMVAISAFFCGLYLGATQYISLSKSKGEVLVFQKRRMIKNLPQDVEGRPHSINSKIPLPKESSEAPANRSGNVIPGPPNQQPTFLWEDLAFEIPVKNGTKLILEDISGWVNPGTLTALIGQTGAGKTSLLNALAGRVSAGAVAGYVGVDAQFKDRSFTQKIGYAQQQDLHLPTATVREALIFSALLRQPRKFSRQEKINYVNTVIEMLDMEKFADAAIGTPGEGLNIEQRKRLTIGVELAARPELLIFFDEPTSGLDSDTAWSICKLLRKLANNGQAILCTIHQPSGMVLEMFDRLLVLAHGKQVYFGDIGPRSNTLTAYFERSGASPCRTDQNPAEWLLDTLDQSTTDWAVAWAGSPERQRVLEDAALMKTHLASLVDSEGVSGRSVATFAAPFLVQLRLVTMRSILHDWRTPSFLWSKTFTTFFVAFLNGVSVWQSPNSIQGLQNQFFSLFIFFTIFTTHTQLILFRFIDTRTLYEARERPSLTFSWIVFLLSSMIADLPGQTCMAVLTFLSWYYPLGWHNNGGQGSTMGRGGLTFLFVWMYMLWTQSFSHLLGAFSPDAPSGIALAQTMFILSLLFSGLLVSAKALPKFWLFLYRASPMSYYVSGMFATSLSDIMVECSSSELSTLDPPDGQTCGDYLTLYLKSSGMTLINSEAMAGCKICPLGNTNEFLATYNIFHENRWRDMGITIAYVGGNVALAIFFYWLARVPKNVKLRNKGREGA